MSSKSHAILELWTPFWAEHSLGRGQKEWHAEAPVSSTAKASSPRVINQNRGAGPSHLASVDHRGPERARGQLKTTIRVKRIKSNMSAWRRGRILLSWC